MTGLVRKFYSYWVVFSIVFFFFLFFIPLILLSFSKKTQPLALKINHFWAWGFFKMSGIPLEIKKEFEPQKHQQYILCANHFSYLDIPSMGLLPIGFKFFGKSQLAKIPLFGLMYKKLHITVDRASMKSKIKSVEDAKNAIEDGFSLCFFPEGGIRLKKYPNMVRFKAGAFRLAAEYDIPILPVTLANNYNILRNDGKFNVNRKTCYVTIHHPVKASGKTDADIEKLEQDVFNIIQSELNTYI